eukprot:2970686-Prorocentrum_lima.AAC.1
MGEDVNMGDARPQSKAGGPEPTSTGGTAAGRRGDGPTAKAAVLLPKERFTDAIEEWKRLPQVAWKFAYPKLHPARNPCCWSEI